MTIKALYPTVRPTLNLDFAKTKALDPRVTFTRASTATFFGADGLIQTAASGAARFDHNPATGESLGLLVEEARTNLNTYSEQFNAWTVLASSALLIQNHGISPSGTLTATLVYPSGNSSTCTIYKNIGGGSGTTATVTIYAKAAGKTWINLFDSGSAVFASFNLLNGVVGYANATITASIASAGNGWYRCSVTQSSSAAYQFGFDVTDGSGTRNVTANGTDGVLVWGAQLEAGAFPTSYIPTVASTVTRAADVASMTGTNFSSWYNVNQSTFSLNFIPAGYKNLSGISITYNLGPSRMEFMDSGYVYAQASNATYLGTNTLPAILKTQNKFAYSYEFPSGSLSMSRNGSNTFSSTPSPSLEMPTHTQMRLGYVIFQNRGVSFTGTFSRLAYYPVRLPDAQLQALTAT